LGSGFAGKTKDKSARKKEEREADPPGDSSRQTLGFSRKFPPRNQDGIDLLRGVHAHFNSVVALVMNTT
jgi:hypothetical protein